MTRMKNFESQAIEREMVLHGLMITPRDSSMRAQKDHMLHSLPMPRGVQGLSVNGTGLPAGALSLGYGRRRSYGSSAQPGDEGAYSCRAKIHVKLPCPAKINATTDSLPHIRMLHLDHAQRDVVEKFTGAFVSAMRKEGIVPIDSEGKEIESLSRLSVNDMVEFVGRYPEFISDVVDTPEFRHLDLVIYLIGNTARASLFSSDPIIDAYVAEAPGVSFATPRLKRD